jgi:uncharacterized membrane protein
MFKRLSDRYIILQEHVPIRERQAMEHMLVHVLRPVEPSRAFVDRLSRDLMEEARRQHTVQQRQADKLLRFFGVFGGLLSVVGGLVLWLLLRQDSVSQERDTVKTSKQALSGRKPSAMPRSA